MTTTTLIETVRVRNGEAPLWYLHLRRLVGSCRALGVPIPIELIAPTGGDDRVHRLLVSRRGLTAGERPVGSTAPVRLVTAKARHKPYPHKTLDRVPFDRALEEARGAGVDDAVLLTAGGYVAESAIWSIFWWDGARLGGPALDMGVLPGVARARLEELAGEIDQQKVRPAELAGRSLFVANAVRGVVPVAAWDGAVVPAAAGTDALAARFWP